MTRPKGEYLCGKNAVPLKKIFKKQLTFSPLSRPERWVYISVWVASVIYLCYSVLKTSFEKEEDLSTFYLTPGWKWIGRNKDQSDFEWDFWSTYLYDCWPWLLAHIPLAVVCRKVTFLYRRIQLIYTLYASVVLCVVLGGRVFALLVLHTLIVYLSALTGNVVVTWLISILLISTLNFDLFLAYMRRWLVPGEEEESKQYLLMMFTTAMCNLRYTSFALEMCWHRDKAKTDMMKLTKDNTVSLPSEDVYQDKLTPSPGSIKGSPDMKNKGLSKSSSVDNSPKPKSDSASPRGRYKRNRQGVINDSMGDKARSELPLTSEVQRNGLRLGYKLTDMWFYCFYLPLFCTGPLLTYDSFQMQWQKPPSHWSLRRVYSLTLSLVKVVWWATFCHLILHYFYFSALMSNERLLSQMSLWSLAGVGFCQGQFFMVKYVLLFGVPASLAQFDDLQTPGPPCCISRVYLYSHMWKEFDRGFYAFIKRYIYIPLGGSHLGTVRRFLASFCCFGFIFIWHGAERDLFVWSLLNFLGVCVEALGSVMAGSQVYTTIEKSYLGPAWSERIKALGAVPLFSSSILAIFTFFKGTSVGYIYYDRLVRHGWPVPILTVCVVLYCCVQTSIEIDRWKKNRSLNAKID